MSEETTVRVDGDEAAKILAARAQAAEDAQRVPLGSTPGSSGTTTAPGDAPPAPPRPPIEAATLLGFLADYDAYFAAHLDPPKAPTPFLLGQAFAQLGAPVATHWRDRFFPNDAVGYVPFWSEAALIGVSLAITWPLIEARFFPPQKAEAKKKLADADRPTPVGAAP